MSVTETAQDNIAADLQKISAFTLAADPELLADFILETSESLGSVEQQLLALEKNPSDTEAVHSVFRAFHTIKGLAGFLGFEEIQAVAHETENILDRVRSGQSVLDTSLIDTILRAADYLNACTGLLREGGRAFAPPQHLLERLRAEHRIVDASSSTPESAEPLPVTSARGSSANSAVKVDTAKLEYLVDMIGELVIAQSIVRYDPALKAVMNPALTRNLAQLARVTVEVQKTAMSMRMVPVGQLFSKMERVVRDLGRRSGKQIAFETAGESAELDRTIIEELGDPLVHMIRNSVDHGLETPNERVANGKSPTGVIRLSAQHEAGHILIQVSDDGRGLNKDRILAKAIERGLITPHAQLSDDEIFRLIFQPGFSTAEQVSDLSGRGVGMDVVMRHIEKLRGRIQIQSQPGHGCTLTFRLPLTLAIIDGLVVGVGQERFIVPIFAIREIFSGSHSALFTIERSREMVSFRGALIPVVRLRQAFGIQEPADDATVMLIVVQCREREFCLAVDRFIGKQEVVIKTLGPCFQNTRGIAGGAILGDGRVGLILDVDTLGSTAR